MNLEFRDSNFITYKIFYNSKYFVIYLFEIKTKNIDMYNRCRIIWRSLVIEIPKECVAGFKVKNKIKRKDHEPNV